MQIALMLGCGHSEVKRKIVAPTSAPESETRWITVDFVESARPTVLFDLEELGMVPIPQVPYGEVDEIHAYEVLEHIGRQGDFRSFFRHFNGLWDILKPGGLLIGSCPSHDSLWAWGDPGHTRLVTPQSFAYLTRNHYAARAEKWIDASSDYRDFVRGKWWIVRHSEVTKATAEDSGHFLFALEKEVVTCPECDGSGSTDDNLDCPKCFGSGKA